MLEAYGVWQEKSMYGRKFMGIVRTTFLIGADQRIARVWPKVSVDGPRRGSARRRQVAVRSRFADDLASVPDHAKLPKHLPKPQNVRRGFQKINHKPAQIRPRAAETTRGRA